MKKHPMDQRAYGQRVSARQRWAQLNNKRRGFLTRIEGYASVTIPMVCLPDHVDQNSSSIQHDWTSVGAQAVNHLQNKIVMALFRPGMPFFRLDPDEVLAKQLATQGIPEETIREGLVAGEQRALRTLDQKAVRPKLNEVVRNLIVAGNTALDLTDDDEPRVHGIKEYVVKRSIAGRVQEILFYERVLYDELAEDVQAATASEHAGSIEKYIDFIKWYRRKGNKWYLTQHVNEKQLDESFDAVWSEDRFPIHILTWDLGDKQDYGTGLVEQYAGDFGTLSTLSESEIKAAVLASDYRWLANPAGVGDVNDFKTSVSGDVIAGSEKDLSIVALVSTQGLDLIGKSADKVIARIGRAFLMNSAVTRDAERVTAEEIRMQANELETSLGGVYSRLAVTLQLPLAVWLLASIDVQIQGTRLQPTIVTGLAALSRNAEAQALGLFLNDLAQLGTLPPDVLIRLKLEPTISTLASAHGILPSKYVKPEAQVQQEIANQQAAATAQANEQNVVKEGAKALAQPPQG